MRRVLLVFLKLIHRLHVSKDWQNASWSRYSRFWWNWTRRINFLFALYFTGCGLMGAYSYIIVIFTCLEQSFQGQEHHVIHVTTIIYKLSIYEKTDKSSAKFKFALYYLGGTAACLTVYFQGSLARIFYRRNCGNDLHVCLLFYNELRDRASTHKNCSCNCRLQQLTDVRAAWRHFADRYLIAFWSRLRAVIKVGVSYNSIIEYLVAENH